eukprot:COSAG06_NODE_3707_length_4993_cov_331.834083_4_plen_66_part_00
MLSPYTIWAYSPKPNTATRDVMREQKRDWLSEQACKAAAWQQLVRGRAASGGSGSAWAGSQDQLV